MTTIIKDETLTAIGDAIREKTGKTNKLTPAEMATEIAGITTGGGVDTLSDLMSDTLESVTFNGETVLKNYFFSGKTALKNVTIPNTTKVGENVFEDCTGLEKIVLGKLVGRNSLWSNPALFPRNCFAGCTSLKDLSFKDDAYDDNANGYAIETQFCTNCRSLKNFPFYKGCIRIDSYAFKGCSSLELTKIQGGIDIFDYAFSECASLKKLWVDKEIVLRTGKSKTFIRQNAFWGDSGLTDVYCNFQSEDNCIQAGAFPAKTTIHYGVSEQEFDDILAAGGTE